MRQKVSLIGQAFGRLKVISEGEIYIAPCGHKTTRYVCLCKCGNTTLVHRNSLKKGTTTSCGCFHMEKKTKHARSGKKDKTYTAWRNMKLRCYDPSNIMYYRYGGRGIKVCERWLHSFQNFLSDMGDAPSGTSLDRYPNNDGNYEPSNCRWATRHQQARNTSRTKMYFVHGFTSGLTEMSERFNISPQTVFGRLKRGVPAVEAFTTPPVNKNF